MIDILALVLGTFGVGGIEFCAVVEERANLISKGLGISLRV